MTHATRPTGDDARPSPRPRTSPPTEEDSPQETVHTERAEGENFAEEPPVEGGGEPHDEGGGRPPAKAGGRRWRWTVLALCIVAVLLLCTTAWLFWQEQDDRASQADRDNVVLAARQGVLNLTGLSHTDADQAYARLLAGATDEFRNQLAQQADSFKQALAQGQVSSSGQISEAGIEQFTGNTATALVAATANIKNTQAPEGENRQYRLRLTFQRHDTQWLISQLEFVA